MMNNKYEYCEKFLENLAKAYTEYNAEYIIHSLANNFHFNSMCFFNETEKYVFDELKKEEYIKYIKLRLVVVRFTFSKFNFCIFDAVGRNEPHLLLSPKTPEGDFACFIAKANDEGLIEELTLTSSRFFHYACKDKKKLRIVMEKAKEG